MTNAIRLCCTYILSKNVPMNTNRKDDGLSFNVSLSEIFRAAGGSFTDRPYVQPDFGRAALIFLPIVPIGDPRGTSFKAVDHRSDILAYVKVGEYRALSSRKDVR